MYNLTVQTANQTREETSKMKQRPTKATKATNDGHSTLPQSHQYPEIHGSHHQLCQFIKHIPVAIAMLDKEMCYLATSGMWLQYWQLESDKIIGNQHSQLFPNLPDSWHQQAKKCLLGIIDQFDLEHLTTVPASNGLIQWVKWNVKSWHTDEGIIGGLIISTEKITPDKQLQQQLELTQLATDNAGDAIFWITIAGKICYTNKQGCNFLGYSESELLELRIHDIDLKLSVEVWQTHWREVKNQNYLRFESNFLTKKGNILPVEVNVNYLEFQGNEYQFAFVRNISQQNKINLHLREAKEQLQAVLNAVPGLVSWVDADLRYIGVNQHLANAYNLPIKTFINQEVGFLQTSPEFNDFVYEFFAKPDWNYAKEVKTNVRGNTRTYLIVAQKYYRDEVSLPSAVFVGLDITERLEMEASLRNSQEKFRQQAYQLEQTLQKLNSTTTQLIQRQKMSFLGQLITGIVHEVNNPINFISGNIVHAINDVKDLLYLVNIYQQNLPRLLPEIESEIEDIELDFIQEDLPKLLDSIMAGSERIGDVVTSLKQFSAVEEESIKTVDIHKGLESTLLILQHQFQGKGGCPDINLIKQYGSLPKVECYPGQLNQVLMHILTNAIDSLEEKHKDLVAKNISHQPFEPQILISTKAKDYSVEIAIYDNGHGMTKEISNRIFEPLFTTKHTEKNIGLGLSISQELIVEKHHGKLYCNSRFREGTEFIIEIPIKFGHSS
ncbi:MULTISPECIES: PAS domain S-box protein [Okeania]|uniref:PAS domain-containing sensor histidine kinase n=1 Tax=Okeania TaxID=1458928 RepID=UPI001F026B3A|nr:MULTISPECIES: PAS domain S-box protein [Okeania]